MTRLGSGFRRAVRALLARAFPLLLFPLLPAAVFAGWLLSDTLTVVGRMHLVNPPPTPIVEDRYGRFLSEGLEEHDLLGFWDMPDVLPSRITRALLVTEDRRFSRHSGVDLRSVARALLRNATSQTAQGASTIAMQVARLQDPAPRVIASKLVEMATAVALTAGFGRDAVLRHYMRVVPMGHQMHGFAYASRRYFRKPVEDLSWAEAALLAAVPRSPSRTDLFDPLGLARGRLRARLILGLLREAGDIDDEEHAVSIAYLDAMPALQRETRPVDALHYVRRLLEQPGVFQENYATTIRSSLDLDLQRTVVDRAREMLGRMAPLGAGNTAVMVLDAPTGEILAYVGSDNYFDATSSGGINYAHTPRSSGSALKPFLFAYGLHLGAFTSASIVADLPLHWVDPGGEYVVSNFDGQYLGPMLYGNALANSRNVAAVRVLEHLGPERVFDLFRELGFHNGTLGWAYYGYGMVLGGLYVTLEDLVRAYGYLAADGDDFTLRWVAGTEDSSGARVRDERGVLPAGLLGQDAMRLVTGYLSDPTRRLPSFPRLSALEFRFPVAIKTGTSQGYRDAWAVGFSRRYVVGAWVGDPQNHAMNHVAGSVIAELVHDLFTDLQPEEREGFEYVPFPPPRDSVAVEVSTLSGELARRDTPQTQVEYFVRGTEPTEYTSVYQRFAVDRRTGKVATPSTPPSEVVTRVFAVLPAEYAAWAAEHGMVPPGPGMDEPDVVRAEIRYPPQGSRFILDPTIPASFQTIGLRVDVEPRVSEVVWVMDGAELGRPGYPYTLRCRLEPGEHRVQVRFPNAFVASTVVTFHVAQ